MSKLKVVMKKKHLKIIKNYQKHNSSENEDFSDMPFEIGERDSTHQSGKILEFKSNRWSNPGLSGESSSTYEGIKGFAGIGPSNYKPKDLKNYEMICEGLKKAEDVDARNIVVKVEGDVAYLSGMVKSKYMLDETERIVLNVSDVKKIENELIILNPVENKIRGPNASISRELGLNDGDLK